VNGNVSKEDFGKLANWEGVILDKNEEFLVDCVQSFFKKKKKKKTNLGLIGYIMLNVS
jgi:hypothetical protein